MNRIAALLLALLLTSVTVTSACMANIPPQQLTFVLTNEGGPGRVQARFHKGNSDQNDHSWSSGFAESQLSGLDTAAFRGPGSHQLRFAVIRESGRMDCAGIGGSLMAQGNCTFAPASAFAAKLAAAGTPSPSAEDWFGLFALDVRSSLIEELRAARYPAPTANQLMAMTAVGVTEGYIRDLARYGYRPDTLDSLVEFKAVGVEPRWIGDLAAIGYSRLPNSGVMQLKALGVDAVYIRSFQAIGYNRLSVDDLVQMKALGVTADFARRIESSMGRQSPDKLVQLKAIGVDSRRR